MTSEHARSGLTLAQDSLAPSRHLPTCRLNVQRNWNWKMMGSHVCLLHLVCFAVIADTFLIVSDARNHDQTVQ